MFVLAAVLVAAGLAAVGSEVPQVSAPLLTAGSACAVVAVVAAVFSRRRRASRR